MVWEAGRIASGGGVGRVVAVFPDRRTWGIVGGEMGKYLVSVLVLADGMTKDEVQTTVESMLYEGREFSNNPHVMDVDYGVVKVEDS